MTIKSKIDQIFDLDDKIRILKDEFSGFAANERQQVLVELFEEALRETTDTSPVSLRTVRIVELLTDLPGKLCAAPLSLGLGHDNPDIRLLSAEALYQLADDELSQIEPAIAAALEKSGPFAQEMLAVLVELDDPEVVAVIERFLALEDVETVSLAVEALVEVGEPSAVPSLQTLVEDTRVLSIGEDENDDTTEWTLGQLAKDAIEMLSDKEG